MKGEKVTLWLAEVQADSRVTCVPIEGHETQYCVVFEGGRSWHGRTRIGKYEATDLPKTEAAALAGLLAREEHSLEHAKRRVEQHTDGVKSARMAIEDLNRRTT